MAKNNILGVLFWIRKSKSKRAIHGSILCRITLNGERATEFSTGLRCKLSDWNAKRQVVKGASAEAKAMNDVLVNIRAGLKQLLLEMEGLGQEITADTLKEAYLGKKTKRHFTLLEVYDAYLDWYEKRKKAGEVGQAIIDFVKSKRSHLVSYLQQRDKMGVLIEKVPRAWFEDIKLFLMVDRDLKVNTTRKVMMLYKSVLEYGVNQGYLNRNPFSGLSVKKEYQDPDFLSLEHLDILENYVFENKTLDRVRDFFIFCCYTGLAWVDYHHLTQVEVVSARGQLWLDSQRQKVRNRNCGKYLTPLAGEALKIYQKYGSNVENLPRMTNQAFNRELKKVQALCGIERGKDKNKLHCHLARHTFVWLALNEWELEKDVIIEMVGHSCKRMLDHYAKIQNERVMRSWENRRKL